MFSQDLLHICQFGIIADRTSSINLDMSRLLPKYTVERNTELTVTLDLIDDGASVDSFLRQ